MLLSFSDDDTPEKHGRVPMWTNKQLLVQALEAQAFIDPDEVFGTDWPTTCDLGAIFQGEAPTDTKPGRSKKQIRPRTSSAHWTPDKMALDSEVMAYKKRMGWVKSPSHGVPK